MRRQLILYLFLLSQVAMGMGCLYLGLAIWQDWQQVTPWLTLGTVLACWCCAVSGRLALRGANQTGRWQERADVLGSMEEAQARGMSPSEWLDGYVERCAAELAAQKRHR